MKLKARRIAGPAIPTAVVAFAVGAWLIAKRRRADRACIRAETEGLDVALARHARKTSRIARQLELHERGVPISLRKRAVSHQVPKAGDLKYSDRKIDIRDLNEILEVDPMNRVCVAESGVTFVDLVRATLRHGLVPVVVPELKTITIGGAVAGCSIESMSFRYGGFHDSCLEYEVITSRGEVLTCTPDNENSLVFQMQHGSFGTLGILSKLKFKLVPATPFVRVDYEKYSKLADYQAAIRAHSERGDVDFMDGIIHSPSELVLSLGHFVTEAPYTHRYDWMKVYYKSTRERREDYLRTADYFFRYDRGVTNVHPKSVIGRFLLGKFMGSTVLLRLAEKLNWLFSAERPTITLDVFIPFAKVPEFMEWYTRTFKFFPLWCVPYNLARPYEWLDDRFAARMGTGLVLDLAIYGMTQTGETNFHKLMEEKLFELGGIKTLISHNYYSESEFWRIWNRATYDRVKAITDPDNVFRDLYDKTCRAARGLLDTGATLPRSRREPAAIMPDHAVSYAE